MQRVTECSNTIKQQEERQKTNGRKMFGIKKYQKVVFKR